MLMNFERASRDEMWSCLSNFTEILCQLFRRRHWTLEDPKATIYNLSEARKTYVHTCVYLMQYMLRIAPHPMQPAVSLLVAVHTAAHILPYISARCDNEARFCTRVSRPELPRSCVWHGRTTHLYRIRFDNFEKHGRSWYK